MYQPKTCDYCGCSRVYMVKATVQAGITRQCTGEWLCFPCFLKLTVGPDLLEKDKSIKRKFMQPLLHDYDKEEINHAEGNSGNVAEGKGER